MAHEPQVRRISLRLRPDEPLELPQSDGYAIYGSLLNLLSTLAPEAGDRVHDSEIGSLHNSGLLGAFGSSDRRHHKTLFDDEVYNLEIGIVDPAEQALFEALVEGLVFDDRPLEVMSGELRVQSFESHKATYHDLLSTADERDVSGVELHFETPACIREAGEVTTMFPYRWAVFASLVAKWNRAAPDALSLELERKELLASLVEKPDLPSLDTHAVLVNRVNDDGHKHDIVRQGFTGTCGYDFKDADDSIVRSVAALARFAPYSGVGSAVARGCGHVEVELR
jgi:hypothetical protein